MTRSLLLVSLAAGALTVPIPASSAATELAIREINIRPASPVVGAGNSVRLVIDVIAKGVKGRDGVTIQVEPGSTPDATGSVTSGSPITSKPSPPGTGVLAPGPTGSAAAARSAAAAPAPAPRAAVGGHRGALRVAATRPGGALRVAAGGPDDASRAQGLPAALLQRTGHARLAEWSAWDAPPTAHDARPTQGVRLSTTPATQGANATPVQGTDTTPAQAANTTPAQGTDTTPAQGTDTMLAQSGNTAPAQGAKTAINPVSDAKTAINPVPGGEVAVDRAAGGVNTAAEPGRAGWPSWFGPGAWTAAREPQPRPVNVEPALALMPVWRTTPGGMRMRDDWQTWRFLPDKALNRFYPSGTWTITATATGDDGTSVTRHQTFQLKRETKLSSVRAEKAGATDSVRLHGSLTRVDPRGYAEYAPFADQRVEILWRAEADDEWERVAVTTTGETGDFAKTVQGRADGFWRARYLGTDHYAPKVSRIHESSE
ncbi:hypothetical protein ACGFNP_45660 [Nonomuraea sp. NPDC049269]|uniref:hypothetical protein n=1 Tax=Nonomuraea sp. NPDC049269 TaxID=3364349 RepID=UPI003723404A